MFAGVVPGQAQVQEYERGWLDVNFGAATPSESEFSSTRVFVMDDEVGAGSVAYGVPTGAAFDIGAGYMFHERVGIGLSLAGTAHEDVAGLAISVPHPLYYDAHAVDATVTREKLLRAEGAWHIHAMVTAVRTP